MSTARSNYPENLKKIWLPIWELLPFFIKICIFLILFIFLFQKLQEIDVKCKLKICSACQDLHALQFWSKSDYLSRSYCPFSSFFSSPDPKGHVRYCHHLASVVRPLTFSYFNLLLWNNLAKWNQTWQKASM